jgi:hypothetical protein
MKRGHNWVIQACGVIADQQARGLGMRGSQLVQLVLGGCGDRFEVDDVATGQVAVRPSRTTRPNLEEEDDVRWSAIPRYAVKPGLMRPSVCLSRC